MPCPHIYKKTANVVHYGTAESRLRLTKYY